jgi:hypothetical protein
VDGHINAKVVAQPASFIAETAGFSIPDNTKFFIVPETGYGPDFPFSGEKNVGDPGPVQGRQLERRRRFDREHSAHQWGLGPQLRHLHPRRRIGIERAT